VLVFLDEVAIHNTAGGKRANDDEGWHCDNAVKSKGPEGATISLPSESQSEKASPKCLLAILVAHHFSPYRSDYQSFGSD
jgi:hypothetical protein